MKRFFIAAAFVAAFDATASAQVEKVVEVTKAYVPGLESAVKLGIEPNMTDTARMRPEIDYTVMPLSIGTSLRTRAIRPATVTYWEFNRPRTCYLKAGAGYPLNSELDFYASSQNHDTGYVIGYINHEGRYDKIRNDFGTAYNSVRTTNRVGSAAGWYIGRHVFEGELSYENRLLHRYGRYIPAGPAFESLPAAGAVIDYGDARLGLRIGDDFLDLSRFNFEVAFSGGIFFDHSDVAERARQNTLGGRFRIGKAFGCHRFSIEGGYEWLDGGKNLRGLRQQQIHAGARYGHDGEIMRLEVGADYYYDDMEGEENQHYIIPFARLHFTLGAREFKPFIEADGRVRDNSFRSLTLQNPYVAGGILPDHETGLWLDKSSVDYNVRLGLGGTLWSNRFDYRVYVGFSIRDHHVYWYGDFPADRRNVVGFSGALLPQQSRQTVSSLHGEIIYRPLEQLHIDLGLHGFLYNDERVFRYGKRIELGNGEPQFRANAAIRYQGRKIACGVGAVAESKRLWSMFISRNGEYLAGRFSVPFSVDLSADFEWKISGRVAVFVEGRNLLDRKLYRYPWYPEYRVSFTAGAKVVF
ncbi:MAG: hypothetical protein K2I85_03330 [Alistipes sp.]|nr:hypothetical protein [Alistipes sp.]